MSQSVKQQVQQQFGPHAANYVNSTPHAKGESLQRLLDLTQPQSQWRMVDIATGGGHTALQFAPHVGEAWATDLTEPMLRAARQHIQSTLGNGANHVRFARCDAENLPFQDQIFDLVTCRIASHHFPHIEKFMAESWRILRPQALLAIVDTTAPEDTQAAEYTNSFEKLRDPSHVWNYSISRWETLFQQANFTVLHRERSSIPHSFTDWTTRLNCSESVTQRLQAMLIQAPQPILDWYQPQQPAPGSTEGIGFIIPQMIMIGRKP